MALIRYNNPFQELEEMQSRLSRLFDESLTSSHSTDISTPTADVYTDEDDQVLVVEAHLPGYRRDEIEINIDGGTLTIRGESQKRAEEDNKRKYILRESVSSYYRRIGLPKNVTTDQVKANFDEGVLTIRIPFKELPKPQSIKIEDSKKRK